MKAARAGQVVEDPGGGRTQGLDEQLGPLEVVLGGGRAGRGIADRARNEHLGQEASVAGPHRLRPVQIIEDRDRFRDRTPRFLARAGLALEEVEVAEGERELESHLGQLGVLAASRRWISIPLR